jgi:two-component system, NtrC family, response regulator AtoC
LQESLSATPAFPRGNGPSCRPVLIVGSGEVVNARLARLFRELEFRTLAASCDADVAGALAHIPFAFTVVDLRCAGPEALAALKSQTYDLGAVIVLSDGKTDSTLDADILGAQCTIEGCSDLDKVEIGIKDFLSHPRFQASRADHDSRVAGLGPEIGLWRSDKMLEIWKIIQQAARVDVTVLISGETGTGKGVVARAIHHVSSRRRAPFVPVNCAAVPRDLLESELFGHERGAFTGAHRLRTGKFEDANRGTIFLDEIGDLDPALQAKLLHVLQDGSVSRVGGKSSIRVDVRVLAATNRDLGLAVATGRFRDDLYYRLNVIHIVVPPLRERRDEIPILAAYFVDHYSRLFERPGFSLSQEAIDRLMRHNYPGNVRELENVIKRMIVLDDAGLTKTSLLFDSQPEKRNGSREAPHPRAVFLKDVTRQAAQRAEREEILKMLEQTRWNRVKAAKLLNISYRSLLYKMKRAGLEQAHPMSRFGS